MEMHTPQSLYDTHGIDVRSRPRSRSRWVRSLSAILSRLTTSFKAALRARRATAELAEMDDRMLRDMGISRSEIETAVRRSTTTSRRRKNSSIVGAASRSREREGVR